MRILFGSMMAIFLVGCSTAPTSVRPLPLTGSDYHSLPRPNGYSSDDLKEFFARPNLPKGILGEFADTCDELVDKKDIAASVKLNPNQLHWCFYAKLSRLDGFMTGSDGWDQKEKHAIKAHAYLRPVSEAFFKVYQDETYRNHTNAYFAKINNVVFNKSSGRGRSPASVR